MRIRSVAREFWKDPLLTEFSDELRLLYIGLWAVADDLGIIVDEPGRISTDLYVGPERPISDMIDVLVATDRVRRMVNPAGTRVLVIPRFRTYQKPQHPTKPALGHLWQMSPLPVPTNAQRNALKKRHDVSSWDDPVVVDCVHCGRAGRLRYAAPSVGLDTRPWDGSLVAGRVEIVPDPGADDGVTILCPACRTDTEYQGPSGSPAPDGTDGFPNKHKSRAGKSSKPAARPSGQGGGTATSSESHPSQSDHPAATPGGEGADILTFPAADPAGEASAAPGASSEPIDGSVRRVFDTWLASTGSDSVVTLDGRRMRVISSALRRYPIEDVLDAVVGWKNVPYNCGDNPDGAVINDITVLLKNATNIERFRDATRRGPARPRARGRRAAANVGAFTGEASVGDWS